MKTPLLILSAASLFIGLSYAGVLHSQRTVDPQPNPATYTQVEEDAIPVEAGEITFEAYFDNPYVLKDSDSEYTYLLLKAQAGVSSSSADRTPLNISVVMDRSGSMNSENKLEYAKAASKLVLDNLGSEDHFSLVTYDDYVNVLQKSAIVNQKEHLKSKVSRLDPGGSTNLSGGLLEGFEQVRSTFKDNTINRVLLLSDGLANKGISDPSELQNIVSQKFTEYGIAVSTFGVGAEYNEDLMTNIAEYGRGNYYFIASADEIPNIFQKELSGLLNVIAQNAQLKVVFPSESYDVDKIFGYTGDVNGNILTINYNDIFSEEEKTVLVRFKKKGNVQSNAQFAVDLTFDNVEQAYQRQVISKQLSLTTTDQIEEYREAKNEEVARNIILFESIENFELATREADAGRYDQAQEIIQKNISNMDKQFKDVAPDSALIKQYELNGSYNSELEDAESKSAQELKYIQKSNKSSNYMHRKKRQ